MTAAEHREWMHTLAGMSIAEMVVLLARLSGARLIIERQEQDLRTELEKKRAALDLGQHDVAMKLARTIGLVKPKKRSLADIDARRPKRRR